LTAAVSASQTDYDDDDDVDDDAQVMKILSLVWRITQVVGFRMENIASYQTQSLLVTGQQLLLQLLMNAFSHVTIELHSLIVTS